MFSRYFYFFCIIMMLIDKYSINHCYIALYHSISTSTIPGKLVSLCKNCIHSNYCLRSFYDPFNSKQLKNKTNLQFLHTCNERGLFKWKMLNVNYNFQTFNRIAVEFGKHFWRKRGVLFRLITNDST